MRFKHRQDIVKEVGKKLVSDFSEIDSKKRYGCRGVNM